MKAKLEKVQTGTPKLAQSTKKDVHKENKKRKKSDSAIETNPIPRVHYCT